MGEGITAPHVRHTWRWRRGAHVCERCKAMIPRRIVEAADLRDDMRGLTTAELLDRLWGTFIKAPR
jgi:hypothetical protein